MERRAENGNFEMCKGSIIKSHELHFYKIHGGYMIVSEVAFGLFTVQFQDWLVALN